MSKVAIVYHSGYGHTAVLAEEVAAGVREAGGEADVLRIESAEQDFADFLERAGAADAIIFGSPTYMGSYTAQMKAFIDASSVPWGKQLWKDKLAAGFTNSGGYSGDKVNTLTSFALLAAQHGMLWVSLGAMVEHNERTNWEAGADKVNRLTGFLGAMAQSENASPEVTPPSGDRKTARLLGMRVTEAADRWTAGARVAQKTPEYA